MYSLMLFASYLQKKCLTNLKIFLIFLELIESTMHRLQLLETFLKLDFYHWKFLLIANFVRKKNLLNICNMEWTQCAQCVFKGIGSFLTEWVWKINQMNWNFMKLKKLSLQLSPTHLIFEVILSFKFVENM